MRVCLQPSCPRTRASSIPERRQLISRTLEYRVPAFAGTTQSADTRHRPVFMPTSRRVGRPVPRLPLRGVRNDWARIRARGARMGCGQPACRFRIGTRAVVQPIAGLNRATGEALRQRSARGWILRLAACPQELSLLPTRAWFVRAAARTCTWTVRPTLRRACARRRGCAPAFNRPISTAPGRSIRNPRPSGPAS